MSNPYQGISRRSLLFPAGWKLISLFKFPPDKRKSQEGGLLQRTTTKQAQTSRFPSQWSCTAMEKGKIFICFSLNWSAWIANKSQCWNTYSYQKKYEHKIQSPPWNFKWGGDFHVLHVFPDLKIRVQLAKHFPLMISLQKTSFWRKIEGTCRKFKGSLRFP